MQRVQQSAGFICRHSQLVPSALTHGNWEWWEYGNGRCPARRGQALPSPRFGIE